MNNIIKILYIKSGWLKLQINDCIIFGSYLEDLPIQILESLSYTFSKKMPFCFQVNAEDKTYVIISTQYEVIIYSEDARIKLAVYEIDRVKFALALFNEIKKNKDNLIQFYINYKDAAYKLQQIQQKIDEINAILILNDIC